MNHLAESEGKLIKSVLSILIFLGICLPFPYQVACEEKRGGIVLIVADFKAGGFGENAGKLNEALEIAMAAELSKRERITVVERESLEKILKEMELGLAGFTEKKNQLKVGRIVGADYIVTGSVIKARTGVMISSHRNL